MLGGLFALLSAATFSLNNALARRGVLTGTVIQALCVTVPIGAPFMLAMAFLLGSAGEVFNFSSTAYMWLCLAGINHFIAGRFFNYWAVQNMGSNLTGPIQQIDIVVSLALAMWLLGEYLTPMRIIGILLIICAPMLTFKSDMQQARGEGSRKLKFTPQLNKGYLGAILSGIAYGVSPILVRLGLEDASIGASLAGGAISYAAASVLLLAFVAATGRTREVVRMDRGALGWFTFAGISVGFAQAFRYAALALVPVSVVAPILRVGLVFRLVFSWFLNRDHEVFSAGVITATVISLLGALLLSMSTELFLSLVALPQWAVDIIQWRWP